MNAGPAGAFDRQFGVESNRQLPPIMVVELASGYDAVTGYSWSELRLDLATATFTAPSFPLTGNLAFDISGDQTLTAGTRCAMSVDRDQGAYCLWFALSTSGGGGSGSGGSGSGSGSGDGCNAAIEVIGITCSHGRRIATTYTIGVGRDGNQLVVSQCDGTETELGPCSPLNPSGTTLPVATLVCPVVGSIRTLATSDDITFEDDIVHLNGPSVIATLPDSADGHGPGADQFIIKNLNAASATVDGNGALIDGAATVALAQWDTITIYSDGTDWFIY